MTLDESFFSFKKKTTNGPIRIECGRCIPINKLLRRHSIQCCDAHHNVFLAVQRYVVCASMSIGGGVSAAVEGGFVGACVWAGVSIVGGCNVGIVGVAACFIAWWAWARTLSGCGGYGCARWGVVVGGFGVGIVTGEGFVVSAGAGMVVAGGIGFVVGTPGTYIVRVVVGSVGFATVDIFKRTGVGFPVGGEGLGIEGFSFAAACLTCTATGVIGGLKEGGWTNGVRVVGGGCDVYT